ncbi:MAG: DUF222 domain-containing protein [Actinobacteria bacterium]|nr:DUF222 domain-containing protein [Actinomycetota bacterium]
MDIRESLDNDIDPLESFDLARASVAAGQRRLLSAIAKCERAGVWRTDGCRDMAQWLSGRMGISNWAARRWAAAAHSLERLPLISAAMEAGSVSVDKVLELCRFATLESEQELVGWAQRVSPATVRRRADVATGQDIQDVKEADRARFVRG